MAQIAWIQTHRRRLKRRLFQKRDQINMRRLNSNTQLLTIAPKAATIKKANWVHIPDNTHALLVCVNAQLDEQWSFVGNKKNQRWLWVALCQYTGLILAFTVVF